MKLWSKGKVERNLNTNCMGTWVIMAVDSDSEVNLRLLRPFLGCLEAFKTDDMSSGVYDFVACTNSHTKSCT